MTTAVQIKISENAAPHRTPAVKIDASKFESRLVSRMQSGDEEAYEVLVRQYGGRMLSVAHRICGNDEDARDALQDAYLHAFKAIERFRGDSQLGTWLHRIVVNASLLKLRARKRHPEIEIDSLLPRFDQEGHRFEPEDPDAAPASEAAEAEETRVAVRECIARLPETSRKVIQLRDIEGLNTEEAALALGISENAVKIRLHRARQALTELLRPLLAR